MSEKLITCDQCKAECCRVVTIEIDEPKTSRDWDDIRWQVAHKNITVYLDNENDWVIEFATDCEQLDENWKCKIYDKRPAMCRTHELDECVRNGEGSIYKVLFTTVSDVDTYLKNKHLKKKLGN